MVALAIASIPYSTIIVKPAYALTGLELRRAIDQKCYVFEETSKVMHYIHFQIFKVRV